ncbi:MAG: Holliday junction branch migration protein RuvA [Actinomycetota bacterium]
MIGSLRGRVLDRDPGSERSAACELLLEVGGIGYRVLVTAATLDRLRLDEEAMLWIHHAVRETEEKLYGFPAKEERVAFEGLLKANGVGPSLALAVLATHPAPRLARILAEDDLNALCEVPGVGKKTAQRLLVELRSSLVLPEIDPVASTNGDGGAATNGEVTPLDDVRDALASLGYPPDQVRRVMEQVAAEAAADPTLDSSRLLKSALRSLAAG